MWVFQKDQLFNLRHAVDLRLEGKFIHLGFADWSKASLLFESEEEAKRFWQVLVLRLGRLDGVLMAEGVQDARQD